METSQQNSVNNGLSGILKVFTLLIIFILSAVQKVQAQTTDSGPSLDNLKSETSYTLVKEKSGRMESKPNGKWTYYDKNGKVVMETTYKKGVKVE